MLSAIRSQRTTQPKPPVPPGPQETECLIRSADQDMFRAQSLDNTELDTDKSVGSVFIEKKGEQPEYERYFVGDLSKGSICRNSREMTEFDGSLVKITTQKSIVEEGKLGTDSTWIIMDRNQLELSSSGAKREFLAGCP